MKTTRIPTGSLITHPVCRTNPRTSRRMRMVCGLALAVIGLSASATPAYAVTATGGTITTCTVGGITYNVHTFTGSGTFHVTAGGDVRYLVVGGGGGGGGGGTSNATGAGGGGGAGGFLGGGSTDTISVSAIDYTVTVGGGGAAGGNGAAGTNGQNSVFGSITAIGGGGGGANGAAAGTGGSGGGGSENTYGTGGSGTTGLGNGGGNSSYISTGYPAGGGGGAGAAGGNGVSGFLGGNGGAGLSSDITGTTTWYAGGGGGATYNNANGAGGSPATSGLGGQGGGGKGGVNQAAPPVEYRYAGSGAANTGGGGGGGSRSYGAGAGGSGVVIISYAQATGTNYTLTYTAGANGSISGTSPQTVASGDNGTAVTPVPATGYHFLNWSDTSTSNPRQDLAVSGDITVTASFAINTIAYNTWASTHAGEGLPDGDSNNDGVENGIAFFMNVTGIAANPALDATTRTVTWTNGGNIPSSDYGNQFVVQTSDDLAVWANVSSSDSHLSNAAGAVAYTFTGTDPRFVRLKVTPNPN